MATERRCTIATLHFKNALFYLQGSVSEAVPISEAMEIGIDVDYDEDPDPAFGDTWETRLKGINRFNGTLGANYDTAQAGNALWEAATASTSRKMYLYPDRATMTNYYYGNIFPKLGIRGSISSKGASSSGYSGDGQLAVKP